MSNLKKNINFFKVIKKVNITKKSANLKLLKKLTLITTKKISKTDLKSFLTKLFNIKIKKINTLNISNQNLYKKFYITFNDFIVFSNFTNKLALCL